MRTIHVAWLLVASIVCLGAEQKEYIPVPGDAEYGKFEKVIYYGNENTKEKMVTISTAEWAEKTGVSRQIDHYKNNVPYWYEIIYTDRYSVGHQVTRADEFVQADGTVTRLTYSYMDKSTWIFEDARLQTIMKFKPYSIAQTLKDNREVAADSKQLYWEASITPKSSLIQLKGTVAAMSAGESSFIKMWCLGLSMKDLSPFYHQKIEIFEDGRPCVVYLQDSLLSQLMERKSTIVYYYYLGQMGAKPIIIVIGFYDWSP